VQRLPRLPLCVSAHRPKQNPRGDGAVRADLRRRWMPRQNEVVAGDRKALLRSARQENLPRWHSAKRWSRMSYPAKYWNLALPSEGYELAPPRIDRSGEHDPKQESTEHAEPERPYSWNSDTAEEKNELNGEYPTDGADEASDERHPRA
jgi:hypothetical protein